MMVTWTTTPINGKNSGHLIRGISESYKVDQSMEWHRLANEEQVEVDFGHIFSDVLGIEET